MEKSNIWEEVLAKTDIVNVISEYIPLTKQGKNFRACCPFHGEKTPSFIVSLDKGIFKCFGCGKSGNAIKFLEYYKHINSLEALKILAQKNNVDISSYLQIHEQNANKNYEQIKILDVLKEANNYFKYQLIINDKNKLLNDFLSKRRLDKKLISYFEIGYAPENNSVYKFLKNKDFDDFSINNTSLISQNSDNKNFFNERITFPIRDEQGNVVAFSARDITNTSNPKYLNSSETIVFKKSQVLFNFYNAMSYIKEKNEVYLVEGQFDVIALYKINVKNAIGLMGTNLTKNHLELLKNSTINLFLDNDAAGINATNKNAKIILYYANELNIKINFISNNLDKDADEIYNLDNGKTLQKIIQNKIDLSQFLINKYLDNDFKNANNDKKNNILKTIFEFAYYMQPSIYTLFKNELIKLNILNDNEIEVFEKQYKVANFPSDKSFKANSFSTTKYVPKSHKVSYDFDLNESFVVSENDFYNKIINKPLVKKIPLIGRGLDMALILKSILAQPTYLANWEPIDIMSFNQDGGEPKTIKELILYVMEQIKKKNTSLKNLINLKDFILNDNSLSPNNKSNYINIIAKINSLDNKYDSILSKELFDKKITELVKERKTSSKVPLITSEFNIKEGK